MALTDNLVSYYKLTSDATDEKGTNNGSVNSVSFGSSYGKIGNGMFTNGSHLTVDGLASIFRGSNQWSVNMWVKIPSFSQTHRLMGANTSGQNYTSYAMAYYMATDGTLGWYHGNGSSTESLNSAAIFSTSTWYMVTLTHDGSTVRAYKDGNSTPIASVTRAYTSLNDTNIAQIGAAIYSGGTETSSCYIDEVGIWSRALSTSEISELYNSGSGLQYPFSVASTTDALMLGHFA